MVKKLNFEQKMQRLEEIQEKMDSGELSLEENSTCFDEAQTYVKECREELEKAQLKVIRVVNDNEEEFNN
jgi:exodeoxyribonuclease VII small subunit